MYFQDLISALKVAQTQLASADMPIARRNRLSTMLTDFMAAIDLISKRGTPRGTKGVF